VIKVESPEGDDTRKWGPPFINGADAAYFHSCNRGKRSVVIDFRTPQGQASILTAAWNLMIQKRDDWNIGGVFWYAWRDPLGDPCTFCGNAGLLNNNYGAKPSFNAFKQITATGLPGS